MPVSKSRLLALALVAYTSLAPAPFSYRQDFNAMGSGTTAPDGWKVFSIPGSHDLFKPADDMVGTGALPTGDDIKGGAEDPNLVAATPDTSSAQKGRYGFNWAVPGAPGNRALGTSPTGAAGMVLQLGLTNTGDAANALSIEYDVLVLGTTTVGNKIDDNNYLGIEELPGYRLYYSLDNGATYTNVAELNDDGHTWPNALGTRHKAVTNYKLGKTWAPGATLLLRWFDDNAQSPSPDQRLGLDNVMIKGAP